MAQRTVVTLIDDLDGSPADLTVTFALNGKAYEIDLTEAHAADLEGALATYVSNARRTDTRYNPRRSRARSSAGGNSGPAPQELREWARANGHEISERGRVPAEVRAAYEAAQTK